MLLFKRKYLDAIRAGRKTQTVRVWKHRRMRAGQRSYIPGAGNIHVEAVDAISLDELDDEDALRDGMASAEELRAELCELYADQMAAGYGVYRVRFRTISGETADNPPV